MEISELYKRDTYAQPEHKFIHSPIYEYDIASAGMSICRELEIIPVKDLDNIEKRANGNKEKKLVLFGVYIREHKYVQPKLMEGFEEFRKRFFIANNITNYDIVSIRRDAIFVTKECDYLNFGHVKFVLKNQYTSYIRLDKYQMYYNSITDTMDVCGLSNVIMNKLYTLIEFIKNYMRRLETHTPESCLGYLKVYITKYKQRELDPEFYRLFNHDGDYRSADGTSFNDATYDMIPDLFIDHTYNIVFVGLTEITMNI